VEEAVFVPGKRCAVGFDQTFITSFGDVRPCCFSDEDMGNVRERTFREIWWGPRYSDFRRRLISGSFAKYCSENRCTLPSVLPY
jgi:MoaA/NifB/PqqE/SkfB family radical SAM enzyme